MSPVTAEPATAAAGFPPGDPGRGPDAAGPAGEIPGDLLGRAVTGDTRAFAEIVRHYDNRLRALAFRLLGDRTAMDDALQEAYVKAFRALADFRGDAALGTWLYRIVYRSCLDHQRREQRHRTTPLAGAGTRPGSSGGRAGLSEPAATGAAAEPAATAAARVDLARALSALPLDQRAAVLLVDAEGFDYDSAAAVLGVAPGTIASRLSRARSALRAALDEGDLR